MKRPMFRLVLADKQLGTVAQRTLVSARGYESDQGFDDLIAYYNKANRYGQRIERTGPATARLTIDTLFKSDDVLLVVTA